MKLEIVDSHHEGTIVTYDDYKDIIPSVGDNVTFTGIKDEDFLNGVFNSKPLYVKERHLYFNNEGLESVHIWIL